MIYQETFQVSNMVVDRYFAELTGAEVKLLIVIIRQTHGWIDQRTGKRKTRDWISHSQFVKKTGLSRRVISSAVQSLVAKGLITATDPTGQPLPDIEDRRGQPRIFYSPNMCTFRQEPVHFLHKTCAESAHNKTNYTKINKTKLKGISPVRSHSVQHIGDVIHSAGYKWRFTDR
jgi:hypothetical protein